MRLRFFTIVCALAAATPALADFTISFTWGDIPLCTSGRPGKVDSPRFVLNGIPAGTETIRFKLKDLDAPGYNHGGGKVSIAEGVTSAVIPAGSFRYKSPCPPGGVHTYEWTATAKGYGGTLDTATARRDYPE